MTVQTQHRHVQNGGKEEKPLHLSDERGEGYETGRGGDGWSEG